jgi:Fe-S cluster biogenesis protein NfuA
MGIFGRRKGDGAEVERRINAAIIAMRPLLRIETVAIELQTFDAASGVAVLRIAGDCPDCDMSAIELRAGIEAHLQRRVPEIREVRTTTDSVTERNG